MRIDFELNYVKACTQKLIVLIIKFDTFLMFRVQVDHQSGAYLYLPEIS